MTPAANAEATSENKTEEGRPMVDEHTEIDVAVTPVPL